jgi:hypothetical protein
LTFREINAGIFTIIGINTPGTAKKRTGRYGQSMIFNIFPPITRSLSFFFLKYGFAIPEPQGAFKKRLPLNPSRTVATREF